MPRTEKQTWSLSEAAQIVGMPKPTLKRWCQAGICATAKADTSVGEWRFTLGDMIGARAGLVLLQMGVEGSWLGEIIKTASRGSGRFAIRSGSSVRRGSTIAGAEKFEAAMVVDVQRCADFVNAKIKEHSSGE